MTVSAGTSFTLPHGFWREDRHHREAVLRAVTGEDECVLAEAATTTPAVRRVTTLLGRCLRRLGPLAPVAPADVDALTVGDREALLLHLRRATFGNRLECLVRCPRPECGTMLDLDLAIDSLLQPPYPDPAQWHERALEDQTARYRVRFRLPTGADQDAVAELARRDALAAAQALVRRCIAEISGNGARSGVPEQIPSVVAQGLEQAFAELDPQAESGLDLRCPACGRPFAALLDAAGFFFRELATHTDRLYREVHQLALHYHWSEWEILAMSAPRRRRYLGLLSESVSRDSRQ